MNLSGYTREEINIGQSSSRVYRCQKGDSVLYLKTAPIADLEPEYEKLLWLNGKLPVPQVKHWKTENGTAHLLLTEAAGEMLTDPAADMLRLPYATSVKILADALQTLQAIDITACPLNDNLEIRLAKALHNIETGQVDTSDWDDDHDFTSPMELYNWLTANKPPHEELCFAHGDFTPENVFADGEKPTCYIDLGGCGIADKWRDIACCVRSISYDTDDPCYVDQLFSHLQIAPNWTKIKYYNLLDELH